MAGFLGKAPLLSDIGFLLEVIVLISLIIGRFWFVRVGMIRAHGMIVAAATILHTICVPLVMISSFLRSFSFVLANLLNLAVVVTLIHVPLGSIVLILAISIVAQWRFRSPSATCFKRSWLMKPLWWLWIFSLFLGLILYAVIALSL